jgi:hypothetical protein
MKKVLGVICLIILVVILVKTNPTKKDFDAHLAGIQSSAVTDSGNTSGLAGALTTGAAAIAKGIGFLAGGLFERQDYIILSTFTFPGNKGPEYLGIAKIFIKLR